MNLFSTLKFISDHPLNEGKPISAILRFLRWQIQSRLQRDITFEWIDGAKLIVQRGMTGATGNIYCGLHEYADMSFLLHLLGPGDTFVDVGANVGSYTILASKVCGASSIAIEPDPDTVNFLLRNVIANDLVDLVRIEETAVGSDVGSVAFSVGRDTTNQVVSDGEFEAYRTVSLSRIDDIVGNRTPTFMKIDVEGYEPEAIAGARRTLAKPELLAIEIETVDQSVLDLLRANGFLQLSYDPLKRCLVPFVQQNSNNALFVRNQDLIESRIKTAPVRSFRGLEI